MISHQSPAQADYYLTVNFFNGEEGRKGWTGLMRYHMVHLLLWWVLGACLLRSSPAFSSPRSAGMTMYPKARKKILCESGSPVSQYRGLLIIEMPGVFRK